MKRIYTLLPLVATFLLLLNVANAQPGCPNINAGPDFNLPCSQACTTLTANAFQTGATNTYNVSQIPYTPFPFTGGTAVFINSDDIWSQTIQLPFTFCFFGQAYNQLVIGANGLISFEVSLANQFCQWNTQASGTLPTTNMYTNSIMGPYHDLDPTIASSGKTVNYQVIGGFPCRIFVVSWFNIRLYDNANCGGQPPQTQQIVLYETTNVIENYIGTRTTCSGWNQGRATQGIQNAAGTQAFVVPGRNNSTWSASNEGWRYTPNGPSIVEVDWLQNGNVIGTGPSVQICPTTYGLYTARATYTPCAGGTPVVVEDDIFVGTLELAVNVDSVKNVCFGQTNGDAYASFSTSSTVLSYGWNPGPQNTTTLTNAAPGTYVFSVSIAGCTRTDTAVITSLPQLSVTVPDSVTTICEPPANVGALTAIPIGGDPAGYNYSWSNQQITQTATGLTSGTYTVTVTDASGCTATGQGSATVNVSPVTFNAPQITPASCNGGTDGQIIVSINNALAPVQYTWSVTSATNDTASGLTTGSYTVTVVDAKGCSATASYQVPENSGIVLGTPAINPVQCQNLGSVSVTATGGSGTLTYNWSGGFVNGNTISNLQAGNYSLTVTDATGCSISAAYTVPQIPSTLDVPFASITNVNCFGGNNGSIAVTDTGATGAVTFAWSNNLTGATISNLFSGSYTVTATDAAGCTATATFNVNQPAENVYTIETDSATCFAAADGSIVVNGGIPDNGPFLYGINSDTLKSSNVFNNLPAGNYTVTVQDNNGCITTLNTVIFEPAEIEVSISPDTSFIVPGQTADLVVTLNNEPANAVFTWLPATGLSCTDCTTPTATVTENTTYVLTISDPANAQCAKSAQAVIILESSKVVMPNAFTPNGDGKNDKFYPVVSYGTPDVKEFRIYNRWGQLVHNSIEPWDGTFGGNSQPTGSYVYYLVYLEKTGQTGGTAKENKLQGSFTLIR